ncbi:MAG: right-handed parallel beta-helix repeat-containing protein [Candidatus Omnitrophica bacterium]|nr:right-handed parallel beta-helix repeat-containing protein [Candidatus Omnitrophota bacterium]
MRVFLLRCACFTIVSLLITGNCFSATYYVAIEDPKASDTNTGTEESPFQSISAAVAKIQPGDTILVKNGTYRESVRGPEIDFVKGNERITLSAYPGHRPVLKGSDIVTAKFEPVRIALRKEIKDVSEDTEYDPDRWRKEIGVDKPREAAPITGTEGGDSHLDNSKAPFVGIYACSWDRYAQMAFVDERPLKQIGLQGSPERAEKGAHFKLYKEWDGKDVHDLRPGSFYYDAKNKKLFVWLHEGGDPNKHIVEASVRCVGIWVTGTWTISGFDARHYDDGFDKGHGAIGTNGKGTIVESCRITHNGIFGLGIQNRDAVIRNNELAYNGVSGLCSSFGFRMLVENNYFHDNVWRGGFLAGLDSNKLHQWKDSRFIRNKFVNEPYGLWLDINCNGILIAENTFENCSNGIYYEISRWGVIVNNVFRNCSRGVHIYSSDALVAHNVFDGCPEGVTVTGYQRESVYSDGHFDPDLAWCLMTVRNNLILNNIIIDSTGSYVAISRDDPFGYANYSDYNAFAWTMPKIHWDANHIKFMGNWDDYYGRIQFWRINRHYDENSIISDQILYDKIVDGRAWEDVNKQFVVGDPRFHDRQNSDYRLRPDSPLRGRGIEIPMTLTSVYIPPKDFEPVHSWAKTRSEEGTDLKKSRSVCKAWTWGPPQYRLQPLPPIRRLINLDEQGPADPGLNLLWLRTGKYPKFRSDIPLELPEDDYSWSVLPENRLQDSNFDKGVINPLVHIVDFSEKQIGGVWQNIKGKATIKLGAACAEISAEDAGNDNIIAQKVGVIQSDSEYIVIVDMKVDSLKEGYTTAGEVYLAAGEELAPVKRVSVESSGVRRRHWNTHSIDYRSGGAKADAFVGKDLYVVMKGLSKGQKTKNKEVVGCVKWDNFMLFTGDEK